MKKDKLTNRERWEALLNGEKPDRVPVFAWMHEHIANVNGLPDIFGAPELSLKAHIRAQELYQYDSPPLLIARFAAGGMLIEQDGNYVIAPEKSVQNEEDMLKLMVPEEVHKTVNAAKLYQFSQLQDQYRLPEITVHLRDPFSMASTLMGVDNLLLNLVMCPELVHGVMKKCADLLVRLVDTWVKEFGPERMMPIITCALSSNKLISPNHFAEFVQPYMKLFVERAVDLGVNKCFAHLCSEQTKNLPHWAKIRWPKRTIFSFGHEVSLQEAAETLPGYIIGGNANPVLFLDSPAEVVLEECRRAINDGKDIPGGYILISGCDVPPKTPPVNVFQLTKAAREFGQY